MRTISIVLSLFLFSCAQYSIKSEYDPYTKMNNVYEAENVTSSGTKHLFLNLSTSFNSENQIVFFKFLYRAKDWLFVEENEGIQILLTNGKIIKLSSIDSVNRETKDGSGGTYGGVYIEESGELILDKDTLKLLLNNPINSIRVYGSNSYIDFTTYTIVEMQQRWKEFSNTHLTDFLN